MGKADGREHFLDLVYETSIDPGVWPVVLQRFAGLMHGHAAAFRSYELITEVGTVVAAGLDAQVMDAHFRSFADRNPLKSSAEQLRRLWTRGKGYTPGTMMDIEWLPKDAFMRTAYYDEVYRPHDIHSDISIGLDAGGGSWTGVDVYRPRRNGPFTAANLATCNAVHPHLVRAFKLSQRLSQGRRVSAGLSQLFEGSPHGLVLVDAAGAIRHLNEAARAMVGEVGGLTSIGGRLACADHGATRRLQDLLDRAVSSDPAQRAGGSMALPTPDRRRPLSITVAPLRAEHTDPLISGPAAIVCVTDLDAGVTLPEQRLRELFELTPAEARVAVALFEGCEPREIAGRLDLRLPTVRTHMARIFDKTQTRGQAELARLMMRTLGVGVG